MTPNGDASLESHKFENKGSTMKRLFVRCMYAGLLMLPGVALAQSQAYTNGPVNLRAGPARDYPLVSQLPGGVPVTVMGCISGYSWCDVALPNLRGWVYAGRLSYPYQGNNVPILNYGPTIGLPIVTFAIGSYWGSYYRNRPWYGERDRWAHRPPPRPRPQPSRPDYRPRPPGHGGPGPARPPGRPGDHTRPGGPPRNNAFGLPSQRGNGHAPGRPSGGNPGGHSGGHRGGPPQIQHNH